jgi:superfamily II DNA/RNA helicase
LEVAYTEEEKQAHAALKKYTALRIKGLAETNKREQFATEFVLKLLKKRLFSSPQAFLNTLQKHFETLHQNKTALNTRNPVATDQLTLAELQRQVDYLEEDDADDERYQEATEVVLEKTTQVFRPLSPEEQDLLTNMQQWASQAAQGGDRKVATLIAWLQENLKPQGQWNDTRVIIFTEYRDTQLWLTRQLEKAGFDTGQRVLLFYGGMESEKREQVKAAFQARPQDSLVRILIATDAASEGLDLQNHCSQLIHYEIPWNPSRLEQRNGRIDRHGQSAPEVKIYHFVAAGYQQGEVSTKPPGELAGDLEFLMRTVSKINKMREDLMGKVGQVIAEQVEEVMLGRRTRLDTAKSEQEAKSIQKLLKVEQDIKKRTQELHDQLHDIKSEMRLNSETLLAVIQEGLKIAGKPPLKEIDVPNLEGKAYEVPALGGSWKKCLQGLEDPLHKGELRPIVFDRDLAKKRDDVVLVHLNHRLAEMCLRVLRTTVWAEDNPRGLYRVTAKVVAEGLTDAPAIVAYSRLLMLSKRQRRLHEEIVTVGGIFREKNFEVLSQERCNRLLDKAQAGNIPQKVKQSLIELWPNYIEPLEAELKKYCEDRKGHLLKKLKERHEREKTDIRKVLQGLEANIKKRLADIDKRIEAEEESQQPSFFDDLERDQFERDQQALEIRLEEIPAELERELALINARYADPRPELIPLALVYLIPKKLSE